MVTHKDIKERFFYDGKHLIYKINPPHNTKRIGKIAGGVSLGYRKIEINGKSYLHSRLIWLYFYGKWPKGEIDHINRNPLDDRVENLRDVTKSVNLINSKPKGKIKEKFIYVYSRKSKNKRKRYSYFAFINPKTRSIVYSRKSFKEILNLRNQWLKENMPERLKYL